MSDSDLSCFWAELFRAVEGIVELLQFVGTVIGTLVRGGGIGRLLIEPISSESGEPMLSSTDSFDGMDGSFANIDDSVVSLFRSWITLESGSLSGS